MSRSSFSYFLLLAAVVFLAGAGVTDSRLAAQPIEPPPRIVTVDGVTLNAAFYPSPKKNSPAVIMLHPIGEGKSSKGADWKRLAEALQKNNYSVITFDFRGHGDSTLFDPDLFYSPKHQFNKSVKIKAPATIMVDDYIKNSQPSYLPVLVNDIAAVKAYLERRNDAGECNTASTIVIGADSGATLGALWINSEWWRYRFTPNPNPMVAKIIKAGQAAAKPEGENVIAAVFLTIQPTFGKQPVSISKLLDIACKGQGMAATFVYGKEDSNARKMAKNLENVLVVKNSKKHVFIGGTELETNLAGVRLLQPALKLDGAIVKYLDRVIEDKGNEWGKRDSKENFYIWRGPGIPTWSHDKGELNLNYDIYNKFIPQ